MFSGRGVMRTTVPAVQRRGVLRAPLLVSLQVPLLHLATRRGRGEFSQSITTTLPTATTVSCKNTPAREESDSQMCLIWTGSPAEIAERDDARDEIDEEEGRGQSSSVSAQSKLPGSTIGNLRVTESGAAEEEAEKDKEFGRSTE